VTTDVRPGDDAERRARLADLDQRIAVQRQVADHLEQLYEDAHAVCVALIKERQSLR
jgi:hypothetical protein